ncbi:MAG TPA: protein kinase, partial [Pyrinomonadaceae bacterium]|nr:protein kinase [Pyrinomonadaceae bacterium]
MSSRRPQVEKLFQAVLNQAPDARASFVDRACAGDAALKGDVETLLSEYERTGSTDSPDIAGSDLSSESRVESEGYVDPMIGRRLGAYQIKREVARGGMGTIYEAIRVDNEFNRRAAIKVVKRGMDTDFVLRRFRTERQILAALNHPNIALLMDGGTTDDGLPYFVMEYIEGLPLYKYCDANQLSIAERLELFLSICDAVHYAHQKQVIHRDIKPSNVLVTADGIPKLLDFGIAKLLDPDMVGDVTRDSTGTAMRLMTPEYASPEQIQGLPTSPATDVYSLGVLLYELLTGFRPYRLGQRAPHEVARVICEEVPPPPSFIITHHGDLLAGSEAVTLQRVSATRKTTLESLRQVLSGDLDSLVMRTLHKDPESRYQSAGQLKEDIERYLAGKPISAWPNSPYANPIASRPETSLAVLPLNPWKNPQADSSADYLGIGLADSLISRLSTIRRLAVRPTTSILSNELSHDPLVAGRKLDVDYVLSGQLRLVGERLRASIHLHSIADGTEIWSEHFDEEFTELLSLEDEISSKTAETIVTQLTADERLRLAKRDSDNPQAHEAFLRACYHWNKFTEEGLAHAIVCFNQAISLDSNYAIAYAGVAAYHNSLGSLTILPYAECAAAAYEAASTAVAIDPTLPQGYSALGQAILCRDFSWGRAKRQFLTAIDLSPYCPVARTLYARQLTMEGRFTEALLEAKSAHDLDPLGR